MIRVATEQDIPRIVDMCLACHAESPIYGQLTFCHASVEAHFHSLITEPHGVVFVSDHGDGLTGLCSAYIAPHWCSDDPIGHEDFLYVAPGSRGGMTAARLIVTIREWAKLRGAKFLFAGCTTAINPERVAKLYERLGFEAYAIGVGVRYG